MVAGYEWFSATRMAGLTAYTISAAACAARSIKSRREDVSDKIFAVLAGIQCTLMLDMAFDWRWKIHDFWMREAMERGFYGQRRPAQLEALGILGFAAGLGMVLIGYRFRRRRGAAITSAGTLLSVGAWCCECLSYHFLDAILYRPVGPLMAIGLVWLILAAVTCYGVWLDGRGVLPIGMRR
jgi:hypothetical protein